MTERFRDLNVEVIAASVDTFDVAREEAEKLKVSFRLAYGLEAPEISTKTGAFYESEKGYLQPTGFIVNPEGKIVNVVFATGPAGRLAAKECVMYIEHLMKQ